MAGEKKGKDISNLNFEDTIRELTAIVGKIEGGDILLQESLQQYERGMNLINHCRGILNQAEKRIEKISDQQSQPEKG